jgi:hypothetical protein
MTSRAVVPTLRQPAAEHRPISGFWAASCESRARQAIRQLEQATQERLFRSRILRHVHRALAAAQYSAKRDHQKLVEVMQAGVAGPWILETLPAGDKSVQHDLSPQAFHADG